MVFKELFLWNFTCLLTLLFVLQWLSLYWEMLIMFLCQFPLAFLQTQSEMLFCIPFFLNKLTLIGMVFLIILEMFHGAIYKLLRFCCCCWILWVGPGRNWCLRSSLKIDILCQAFYYFHFNNVLSSVYFGYSSLS